MPPSIAFDAATLRELPRALAREWIETNALGGWAASTLAGAHTRRYHGLLVVAVHPPLGRMVLLSRLDETLVLSHERLELSCNLFPGAVHPQGHRYLCGFALDPFPTWTYAAAGMTLRKRIAALGGEHTTVVIYELLQAAAPVQLELRPFFAGRDYHSLAQANDHLCRQAHFGQEVLRFRAYEDQPEVHLLVPGAHFTPAPEWYYHFEYPRERERGLDFREDLFTCGLLRCLLEPGQPLGIVASTADPRGRDGLALLEAEARRRAARTFPPLITVHPVIHPLARATGAFVVRRGGFHTLLAGYPWFTDWGRDTMISLPGICLVTGRHAEARSILRAFAAHIDQGMIPNRFPDRGETPEYNTVDATLWFIVALYKYVRYTGDLEFLRSELWEKLREIIAWHRRGTRFGIKVDREGLLRAGAEGVQLTWMDARVGEWIVTPRRGKAVEINALWYNALRIMSRLAGNLGETETAHEYAREAQRSGTAFGRQFWNGEEQCLFDVVDDKGPDPSIRPNQLFALSLPFPLLAGERARKVLETVDRHLFTPMGLRSLSPEDPAYRAAYGGPPQERDAAYHQGVVWAWLMGPFITALVRTCGEAGKERARKIISGFEAHLSEAGLGTVSEIFDPEPPFAPRGCIAQAWSVAELLRAYCEDVAGEESAPLGHALAEGDSPVES